MPYNKHNLNLARAITPNYIGSRTKPELAMESGLINRGIHYEAQPEFGHTRPDFLALNPHTGQDYIAIYVDGDYWHRNTHGHDFGKANQLIGYYHNGLPITNAIRISEQDLITQPDYTIDRALAGEQLRVLA